MPGLRARRLIATGAATLLAASGFWLSTEGAERRAQEQAASERTPAVALPHRVFDPSSAVGTTADRGPAGRVVLAFAVEEVHTGLSGSLERPWVVVSSDGDYRALSAPHLPRPRPHALRVADDGGRLAWGAPGGVVVYDPLTDDARTVDLGLDGTPAVGPFSPDTDLLVVHDGRMHVVRLSTGEVVATDRDAPRRSAVGSAWAPDGQALTYAAPGGLRNLDPEKGTITSTAAPVQPGAALAWDSTGRRLAAEVRRQTGNRVRVLLVSEAGEVRPGRVLHRPEEAIRRLLGFGDGAVVTVGRRAETGNLSVVYRLPLGASPSVDLAAVPQDEGILETLAVADDALATDPRVVSEPSWPYRDLAKLVGIVLGTVFVLGIYLTRNPVRRSRHQAPVPPTGLLGP